MRTARRSLDSFGRRVIPKKARFVLTVAPRGCRGFRFFAAERRLVRFGTLSSFPFYRRRPALGKIADPVGGPGSEPGRVASLFFLSTGLVKIHPDAPRRAERESANRSSIPVFLCPQKNRKILSGSRFRDDLHAAPRLERSRHRYRSTDELPLYRIPEFRDPTPKNLGVIRC